MSDDFGSQLMKILVARMVEGESQIQENIQWTPQTKALIPLAQAATAALGITALIVGLGLLGWGAGRMIDVEITVMDALLVGVMCLLLLASAVAMVRWVLRMSPTPVVAVFCGLVLLIILAAMGTALARDGVDTAAAAALGLATAVLVAGGALTYRQLVDLLDPFGKTSPMERMIAPHIPSLFGTGEGQAGQARRLTIPYRLNGALREPLAAARQDGEPIVPIHRDDLALIEFIREAGERGLSRRAWLVKGRPNVVLPRSGVEIGRDTYDAMIATLAEWGFVTPGGEGQRSNWLTQPESAVERIEQEIVAQLVEGQA